MDQGSRVVAIVVFLLAAAGGGYFLWRRQQPPPPAVPAVAETAAPAPAPPPPPPAAAHHPVAPASTPGARPLPALADSDSYIETALIALLGRKEVASMLQLDGFAGRLVSTVDNLPREHASSQLWPVHQTPGTFETETRADVTTVAAANDLRYAAFARFVDAVDTRRAVALYVRLYPLFQQSYEDLGSPGKYFNNRVVEVIDHLLAAPEVAPPLRVKLVAIDGQKTARPGGVYKFEDPALEARSAGHKILLRIGPENAAKLKAKLVEIRRQLVSNDPR